MFKYYYTVPPSIDGKEIVFVVGSYDNGGLATRIPDGPVGPVAPVGPVTVLAAPVGPV
jgi:hypothetical protein